MWSCPNCHCQGIAHDLGFCPHCFEQKDMPAEAEPVIKPVRKKA